MGIASLIIGIVALILGLIPMCGLIFGLPPAVVGLILGIVELSAKSKKQEPKGLGIAGTILNALAIVVVLVWTLVIGAAAKESAGDLEAAMQEFSTGMEQASEEMQRVVQESEKAALEAGIKPEPAAPGTPE